MKASFHRAAVLQACNASLSLQQVPRVLPQSGQLLLKVKAAAINPSDWKMQQTKNESQLPCILGSDIAGMIEMIGEGESEIFNVGDRVAAFAGGAWSGQISQGGLQEYVLVHESNTMILPSEMSFEQAATIPMALATAAGAIWHTLRLPRPRFGLAKVANPKQAILVYGASSSVGLLAIQIARSIGLIVIAIASQRHNSYITSLGAHYFFDRHNQALPLMISNLIKKEGLFLELGIDAISNASTLAISAEILSRSKQTKTARLTSTLDVPKEVSFPEGIIIERTSASHFHTEEENAKWLFQMYMKWAIQTQMVRPAPPFRVVEGGLDAAQKALDLCRKGVSCEKLIITI